MAKKGKVKKVPRTIVYTIPTEAFDKPLLLSIVIGEQTDEHDVAGRYCPSRGEMTIFDIGWQETLYHEVLEGSILVNMAHYTNNYDPSDLIMFFDHKRFTSICSYASAAYVKLYFMIVDVFEIDGNTIIGLSKYGKELLRKSQIEVKEIF